MRYEVARILFLKAKIMSALSPTPSFLSPAKPRPDPLTEQDRLELFTGLTPRQRLWVIEFLTNGYNATQAARDAGYDCENDGSYRVIGYENRHHPAISVLLADTFQYRVMSLEEALARLTSIAETDAADFLSVDEDGNWRLDLRQAAESGKLHAIKEIKEERTTTRGETTRKITVKLHDKQKALTTVAKAQGAFETDEDGPASEQHTHYHFYARQAQALGADIEDAHFEDV